MWSALRESAENGFHLMKGPGGPGTVAVAAIKMATFNATQTVVDGWDGVFFLAGEGAILSECRQPRRKRLDRGACWQSSKHCARDGHRMGLRTDLRCWWPASRAFTPWEHLEQRR